MVECPTIAQRTYEPEICYECANALKTQVERWEIQRKAANKIVYCKLCRMGFRAVDFPNPGECPGCKHEAERQRKLEERRKNPPMCIRCKKTEDADEPMYPGLCMQCIDDDMEAEWQKEQEEEEAERKRDEEEWAILQAGKKAAAAQTSCVHLK